MKISESEVILIVVLVLIGFVLYTCRTMKTTGVKTFGGKHDFPDWFPPDWFPPKCASKFKTQGFMDPQCPCKDSSQCWSQNCNFDRSKNLYKDYPGYGYCMWPKE
jgi:hypothetical protein